MNLAADLAPAMRAVAGCLKASFIKINNVFKAIDRRQLPQLAQKSDAFVGIALAVFKCFFYG